MPLLQTALDAAAKVNIPKNRVYLLDLPKEFTGTQEIPRNFKTVGQLILEGASYEPLESLRWEKGQGARQVAFLCYSSGTSGLPVSLRILREPIPEKPLTKILRVERSHDIPS